jgi:PKD repeat protein
MFRISKLIDRLDRTPASTAATRRRRVREARDRRRFVLEPLEDRILLSTTVFLDFGIGVGMGATLNTTAAAYRDIFGAGTGTNLTDDGLAAGSSIVLTPLQYDFDLDGDTDNADITALSNAVVPLAQRALEPFDIDIAVGNAANLAAAVTAVDANDADPTGHFDAYVFVMTATSDAFSGNSIGDTTGLFGSAAGADLNAQAGNDRDEAALAFADEIFSEAAGVQGTAAFNADLAQRIAYTAVHEAFHTFSYVHTPDESTGASSTAQQRLLASGDVIRRGSVTRGNPFIATRYDLEHLGRAVAEPNNYLLAANDPDIGLRDDDGSGRPDLAYATGTGANDLITFGNGGGGIVNTAVNPFSNQARTTAIGAGETYTIDLATETDGTILVDASINADEVRIDATIDATFRARGGVGADSAVSATADQDLLTLQANGLSGTYTPGATGAGVVNYAGGAIIDFSEFENLDADGIGIDVGPLDLSSTILDEGATLDLSGVFVNIDTLDTHQVVISWGDGTANTVLNLVAGARAFAASHIYRDDDPSGTPADDYEIIVTVTDEDADSGGVDAEITVNNVNPVIVAFVSDATFADKGEEGEPVTVTGSFTDVGVLDTHVATVDWGDGTIEAVALVQGAGSGTVQGSHAYAAGGIYTVTLTVTDDDTGSHQAGTLAVITGVGLSNGVLYIIGSAIDDRVHVNETGQDVIRVQASFIPEHHRAFAAADVDQIISYLCDGDDRFTMAGKMTTPTIVHGDGGNDHLHGGGGPTVLLGGSGDDTLIGQGGQNILIGGTGSDRLVGGNKDDVLIGGRTTIDHNQDAALTSAVALWTDPLAPYQTRATALTAFLIVVDDGAGDVLTGSAGRDLFFAATPDVVTDRKANELVI